MSDKTSTNSQHYTDTRTALRLARSSVRKRMLDIVGAGLGLLIITPLLFIPLALLIKLDSPGPVFFRQERNGRGGTFRILKFRTMSQLASRADFRQATPGDDRVTRIGKYLRRYSIDELPQLWNVLVGEMSLVGPRPHPIALDLQYNSQIPNYSVRYFLKPGLTGWAQIHGFRGETKTLSQMEDRVRYDHEYVENWSFKLDLFILIVTVLSTRAFKNAH